jgi:tetratricopeptide (TPR) repeat protein
LQVNALSNTRIQDVERLPAPTFRRVFVGRADYLNEVLHRIENLGGGGGGILTIAGEPGVGKSRLLEEARRAARMVSWHTARCRPSQATLPLGAWNDLLLAIIGASPLDSAASIEQHLREWLEERELGDHLRVLTMQIGLESAEGISAYRFGSLVADAWRAILGWIVRGRPAVIVLDEAHLMDELSLGLFEALVMDVQEQPLLWVLLMQPSFYGQAGEQMLTRQSQRLGDAFGYIGLPPLEEADIRLMVRGLLGHAMPATFEETFAQQVHGNPMMALHALRYLIEKRTLTRDARGNWQVAVLAMRERLPDGMEVLLERRLSLLPAETRAILNLAAVAGNALLPGIIDASAALNRVEAMKLLRTIDYLDDANQFPSSALRLVIVHLLDPKDCQEINQQIATTLEQRMQLGGSWQALYAYHLGDANQKQKALRLYAEAKNWAYERGALQDVSEILNAMLEQLDRNENPDQYARLLVEQQDLLVQQNDDPERSLALLREAYDLWMKVENVAEAADTMLRAAAFHKGTPKELECYRDAEKLLERADKRHTMLPKVYLRESLYFMSIGKDAEAEDLFERARKLANQIPDYAALAEINFETGRVLRDNRRLKEAYQRFNQALGHYSQLPGAYIDQQILTRNYLGDYYNHTGHPQDGEYYLLEATTASVHGSDLVRLQPFITLSECYALQARFSEALDILSSAPSELDSPDMPIQFWVGRWQFELNDHLDGLERMRATLPEENLECLFLFIDYLLEAGNTDEARMRLTRLLRQNRIRDYHSAFPVVAYQHRLQGRLAAAEKQYATALPELRNATQAFDSEGFTTFAISTRRIAAQALLDRGTVDDRNQVRRIIDQQLTVIRNQKYTINGEIARLLSLRKRLHGGLDNS